ncbi:Ger(x)C family spore germination protein [Sporomusa termitida]|uniref:Germination protein, Ger(X)C family n=1 Tax=Sporomusa termitida TaxID=2377 RepID=A0A517DVY9_9FIRM|nr:Ger(x)C family spore germination protein [Sporomusa termitida]QDR81511.1 germination protein, Ger(x)C family [Sporomusa termitida]
MDIRLKLAACLLLLTVCTAGCNGGREIDDFAYVVSVGIDPGPDNQSIITYQIATGQGQGGKENGTGEASTFLITIVAPSLAEARNLLNSVVARTPNLSHTKAVIIGEDLARQGIGDILGPLLRFREFRGSMFITVTRGSAQEFMQKNKPSMEKLPSRWLENSLTSRQDTGYFLASNLHQFYTRLKSTSGAPYATYMGINPLDLQPKPVDNKDKGEEAVAYYPAGLGREGGDPAEVIGTAVFVADKMVGALNNEETRVVSILSGDFVRGFITVTDPLAPQHGINVHLRLGQKPEIKPAWLEGRLVFTIKLLLEGEITSIPSGINYENREYGLLLEQHIANVLTNQMEKMLAHTQELGSDVVGFGLHARNLFSNFSEVDQLNWYKIYPTVGFNLNVSVKTRRTGLMYKSSPIKTEADE